MKDTYQKPTASYISYQNTWHWNFGTSTFKVRHMKKMPSFTVHFYYNTGEVLSKKQKGDLKITCSWLST